MNVLFFLEPSIEFKNPLFRYTSLKNSIIPQVRALEKYGDNVIILINTIIAEKIVEDGLYTSTDNLAIIDPFEWTNGEDYNKRAIRLIKYGADINEIKRLDKIIKKSIPKNFIPDVVICWESPAHFIKSVFPDAKIFFQTPGFFSRAPFPFMINMNSGLLSSYEPSTPCSQDMLNKESGYLDEYRLHEHHFLSTCSPLKKLLDGTKSNFSAILLFALQPENYFMIDSCTDNKKQYEIIYEILKTIPRDCALLVTNYISKDIQSNVISSSEASILKRKFANFIYDERLNKIYCSSQFIVPEVDGVITISSSVGLQAAFWKKPLLVYGKNHISPFQTAHSIEALLGQIGSCMDRDKLIISTIKEQNIPVGASSAHIHSWIHNRASGTTDSNWLEGKSVGQWLEDNRREVELLKAINFTGHNLKTTSPTHSAELAEQIRKHDIISFDIFDTLLLRPFMHPTDLFEYLNSHAKQIAHDPSLDFAAIRKQSERIAFCHALERGDGEITISEIYQVLSEEFSISEDVCRNLMKLEIRTEKKFLYRRETGYNAFLEAKQQGKKIIIVSDMYLDEIILDDILKHNGYNGYIKIYVSSKYKTKKIRGGLYQHIIDDFKIPPEKILHIGDNIDADIISAKKAGLHACHIPAPIHKFREDPKGIYVSLWARDEEWHSPSWKVILSILGNHLYDNPYMPHRKGTLFDGIAERLGYSGFGPLLLGFAKWLCEQSSSHNIDRLYFLSRDGKIMKDAYDCISSLYPDAPMSHYLYCSRRAVNLAKIQNLSDIMDLLHVDFATNTTLGHLLVYRFGLNSINIPEEVFEKYNLSRDRRLNKGDLPLLRHFFREISPLIIKTATAERTEYISYLDEMNIYSEGNVAIVDIGYNGTMQESLFILGDKKKKIDGYYLISFRTALKRVLSNGLDMHSFLAEFIDRHDTYHPFCRHVPLYETLFSNKEPTFIKVLKSKDGKQKKIFMSIPEEESRRREIVTDIHDGALKFVKDTRHILQDALIDMDIEPFKTCRPLIRYFDSPHPQDAAIMAGVVFEDAYGGVQKKIILPPLDTFEGKCVWKQGFESIQNSKKTTQSEVKYYIKNINSIFIKLIYNIIALFLNKRKKNKLLNNPYLFFHDSKSRLVRFIGKFYLRYYRK